MPRKFGAKNLSVSLNPTRKFVEITKKLKTFCVVHSRVCHLNSIITAATFNTFMHCPRTGSVGDDGKPLDADPEIYVSLVAELRADLQAAIKQLDAHEKDLTAIARTKKPRRKPVAKKPGE